MWLTALLPMPSARAMAMPLLESWGSGGTQAPWKSWLTSLRPLSEYWPRLTASWVMGRTGSWFVRRCRSGLGRELLDFGYRKGWRPRPLLQGREGFQTKERLGAVFTWVA